MSLKLGTTDISGVPTTLISTVNNKLDASTYTSNPRTNAVYITETYHSGSSWYRVYSDGWCEQGGFQTSSGVQYYLKPFKDDSYTLISKGQGTYSNTGSPTGTSVRQNYTQTISSYNSTSFTTGYDTHWKIWWYACGYIN